MSLKSKTIIYISGAVFIILIATGISHYLHKLNTTSVDNSQITSDITDYIRKAGNFQMADQSDSSIFYYRKALYKASKIHDHSFIAKTRNGIANYYLRREEYPQAVKYLTDALKSAEIAGDKHSEGLINNGLGLVNISIGKPEKAIGYFEKARKLCLETNDLPNAAGISLNIANCYVEQNDYLKAREFYNENLSTLLKINDTSQIILAYINLATVNRFLKESEQSFEYLAQAFSILEKHPDNSLKCTALLELGSVFELTGDNIKAKQYYNQSLAISSGTLARTNAMEALARLSQVAEKEQNYALALKLHRRYDLIKDSVMNDETRKSISEIQLKADVQKKEFENRLLTDKIDVQKKRNLTLTILSTLIILIALLIALLVWLSLKNLKKSYTVKELENLNLQEKIRSDELLNRIEKLKYESEIESKSRELTSVSLQLVNKNKILSEISLMSTKYRESGVMDSNTYNGLQKIVLDNLNTDKEWDKFKGMFDKVHSGFFIGLKDKFPGLSENELRLCAYLRINLQNKEIARILNVSPPTVVTSRYRIRKKMCLDNKVVLEDFLRNF